MIDPLALGLLFALGTWSALDGSSVGQFMISRPMVSATLAGCVLSDPATGLLVGVLLEGVHLGELPAGGVRLPEPGPAGIPAALIAIQHPGPGGIAVAVGFGVLWSLLGGQTVFIQRRINGLLVRVRPGRTGRSDRLERAHWACVSIDALRGFAVTAAGVVTAFLLPPSWIARWPLGQGSTIALLALPGLLASGSILRAWASNRRRHTLFLMGYGGGLVLATLL